MNKPNMKFLYKEEGAQSLLIREPALETLMLKLKDLKLVLM